MHSPIVREIVRERSDTIEGGRFAVHTWNDLLGVFPGLIGVKTGHTNDAGWCEVAAARRAGLHDLRGDPRQPDARRSGTPTSSGCSRGASRSTGRSTLVARAAVRVGGGAVRAQPRSRSSRGRRSSRVVRVGRPLVERIVAPTAVALPVRRGERLGRIEVWDGRKLLGTRPLLAGAGGFAARPRRAATVVRAPGPCITCWGSSRDRHRHPQRRGRSHAHRAELPARPPAPREREPHLGGRQGHQRRARAEAARRAGDRDRPRGRAHRRPDHRGARRARRSSTTSCASATSRARRLRSSIRRRAR